MVCALQHPGQEGAAQVRLTCAGPVGLLNDDAEVDGAGVVATDANGTCAQRRAAGALGNGTMAAHIGLL